MSRKERAILTTAAGLVVVSTGLMAYLMAGFSPWYVMPGTALYIAAVVALCQFLGFNDRRPR